MSDESDQVGANPEVTLPEQGVPPEPGVPPAPPDPPSDGAAVDQQVASYLHTGLILLLMAFVATVSALGHAGQVAPPPPGSGTGAIPVPGPMISYITTWIWQLSLLTLVLLGVRHKGFKLGDLMGKRWRGFDDVLMDVVYAAGFFIVSKLVLAVIVVAALKALQLPDDTFTLKKSLDAVSSLTPRSVAEIAMWIGLSVTAGFVEEIVFRGYLQRQMTALTRNVAGGIVISALIFGAAHAYQGFLQVTIITALGAMFGVLAHWRKSLKPGIIAHAGQDVFSGIALSWFSRHPIT